MNSRGPGDRLPVLELSHGNGGQTVREINLKTFRYSPGYSDMRGAQHETALIKNGDGAPVMECRDREDHASPAVVTT